MHHGILQRRRWLAAAALACALPLAAHAQKKYDTGASDTEIKIGSFLPYSGPVSAYGTIGRTHAAYFEKINAEGGINGRKITLLSMDDAYNPAQSVEQTRKLVERERVLLLFAPLGTSHNQAVRAYLNQRKIPHLFLSTGSPRFGDPKNFPWTMGFQPSIHIEGEAIAKHILQNQRDAKVGILVQNDDFGKDYLQGVMQGFGAQAQQLIVMQQSYEVSDPTVDSQMVALKNSGANVFINISTPKFGAQTIRKMAEIGWKPQHYLANTAASIQSVLKPAGFDNAKGLITASFLRDPTDPAQRASAQVVEYLAFMQQYHPAGNPDETLNILAYSQAQALVQVLRQCGDDLTRANVMKQATSLDLELPMLADGIRVQTSADNYFPVRKTVMLRFDGTRYVPIQ